MAQKAQAGHVSVPDQLKLFAVELLEKVRVRVCACDFLGLVGRVTNPFPMLHPSNRSKIAPIYE